MWSKMHEIISENRKFAGNIQLKEVEVIHPCEFRKSFIHEKESEIYANRFFQIQPKMQKCQKGVKKSHT